MQGHNIPHTLEAKIRCSIAQKRRWAMGAYTNRKLDYVLISAKRRNAPKTGKIKNCLTCKKSFYTFLSEDKKYCSRKCMVSDKVGKKHHRWNGGPKYPSIHLKVKKYIDWRKEVFLRDNYTCQMCGVKQTFLHPHHIKSYVNFPALRYEVDNGTTLCVDCHKKLHSLLCNIRRWLKSQ
jgi:5-methylcytosine-specific restriction endonuclease McrA